MNSNGTALNINNGKALLEAGLDGMFISFDAVNPKDYETQRVGTTIGRTIDNLYNFSKLRDKIRPGCKIRVSMVMYDDPKWMEQYKALQGLQNKYQSRGFRVLGFPCNDFGNQEPGELEEIKKFCSVSYGATFQLFQIVMNQARKGVSSK